MWGNETSGAPPEHTEQQDPTLVPGRSPDRPGTSADAAVETALGLGSGVLWAAAGDDGPLAEAARRPAGLVTAAHPEAAVTAAVGQAAVDGLAVVVLASPLTVLRALPGLNEAAQARYPVLVLAGRNPAHVPEDAAGIGVDLDAVLDDLAVRHRAAHSPALLPALIAQGATAALRGQGVSVVSVPWDVAVAPVPPDLAQAPTPQQARAAAVVPVVPGTDVALEQAADVLLESRRVTVLAGQQSGESAQAVVELSRRLAAPVVASPAALAGLDGAEGRLVGVLGAAAPGPGVLAALTGADALLVVGTALSGLVTHGVDVGDAHVVHAVADSGDLGRPVEADSPLAGPLPELLGALAGLLAAAEPEQEHAAGGLGVPPRRSSDHLDRALDADRRWRAATPIELPDTPGSTGDAVSVPPALLGRALDRLLAPGSVVVADPGRPAEVAERYVAPSAAAAASPAARSGPVAGATAGDVTVDAGPPVRELAEPSPGAAPGAALSLATGRAVAQSRRRPGPVVLAEVDALVRVPAELAAAARAGTSTRVVALADGGSRLLRDLAEATGWTARLCPGPADLDREVGMLLAADGPALLVVPLAS